MDAVGGAVMKNLLRVICVVGIATCSSAQTSTDVDSIGRKLDTDLFEAYNSCNLAALSNLFAQDAEFYHDKGGLMIGRQGFVDAVKENICGKVRRELVPNSLRSFPMDNYGLVQFADHRFCTVGTNTCTGVGRSVILWRQTDGRWQATRIISYDHKPL
jgi:Domain of unknown function (DUF4440)